MEDWVEEIDRLAKKYPAWTWAKDAWASSVEMSEERMHAVADQNFLYINKPNRHPYWKTYYARVVPPRIDPATGWVAGGYMPKDFDRSMLERDQARWRVEAITLRRAAAFGTKHGRRPEWDELLPESASKVARSTQALPGQERTARMARCFRRIAEYIADRGGIEGVLKKHKSPHSLFKHLDITGLAGVKHSTIETYLSEAKLYKSDKTLTPYERLEALLKKFVDYYERRGH